LVDVFEQGGSAARWLGKPSLAVRQAPGIPGSKKLQGKGIGGIHVVEGLVSKAGPTGLMIGSVWPVEWEGIAQKRLGDRPAAPDIAVREKIRLVSKQGGQLGERSLPLAGLHPGAPDDERDAAHPSARANAAELISRHGRERDIHVVGDLLAYPFEHVFAGLDRHRPDGSRAERVGRASPMASAPTLSGREDCLERFRVRAPAVGLRFSSHTHATDA
jgi:hypothetical protein